VPCQCGGKTGSSVLPSRFRTSVTISVGFRILTHLEWPRKLELGRLGLLPYISARRWLVLPPPQPSCPCTAGARHCGALDQLARRGCPPAPHRVLVCPRRTVGELGARSRC
jgi:hypothetical protein